MGSRTFAQDREMSSFASKCEGMLVGSLLGDALGGPVEFDLNGLAREVMPNLRDWPDDRIATSADFRRLAESLELHGYERLRPGVEPYGQWKELSLAGTVTDDSRHKIVMMDALRKALREKRALTRKDLAKSYLAFDSHPCVEAHPGYEPLLEEGHREFRLASRWILGERDPQQALPPERMWNGVGTCCGMMTLLPIAAACVGDPQQAYLAAYELGFFDNGNAKDINPSLVAGLSVALEATCDLANPKSRRAAWRQIEEAMLRTDPLRYSEIPYLERPVATWFNFACEAAKKADGSPKRLYRVIAEEVPHQTAWEAQVIFSIVFAFAEFCDYDPLATLHLILDYGEDTDSSAQLFGAFAGALHGQEAFPAEMLETVRQRFQEDYLEDLGEWVEVLTALSQREMPLIEKIPAD